MLHSAVSSTTLQTSTTAAQVDGNRRGGGGGGPLARLFPTEAKSGLSGCYRADSRQGLSHETCIDLKSRSGASLASSYWPCWPSLLVSKRVGVPTPCMSQVPDNSAEITVKPRMATSIIVTCTSANHCKTAATCITFPIDQHSSENHIARPRCCYDGFLHQCILDIFAFALAVILALYAVSGTFAWKRVMCLVSLSKFC